MSCSFEKNEGYTVSYIYAIAEDGTPSFIQRSFADLKDAREWVDAIRRCQDMRDKRTSRLRRFFERRKSKTRDMRAPLDRKVIEPARKPSEDKPRCFDAYIRYKDDTGVLHRHVKRGFASKRERDAYVLAYLANLPYRSFAS